MTYTNDNLDFPIHEGDIKLLHQDWAVGDPLPNGFYFVNVPESPEFDSRTHYLAHSISVSNDVYSLTWDVMPLSAEQRQALADAENDRIRAFQQMGLI